MADRARPQGDPHEAQLLRPRDGFLLSYVAVMAPVACFLPARFWERFCGHIARLTSRIHREGRARDCEQIRQYLDGHPLAQNAQDIVTARAANWHQAQLQILRWHANKAWRPHIHLSGREHIEQALAGAKGAILWVMPSTFSNLITKMAFHQAGYPVSHLSRSGHGFSRTRFGVRVLNPIVTAAERHYLAERLVMAPGQPTGALKALVARVLENGLVSISVNGQGQRTCAVPFFGGTIRVADGAPSLAQRTGAALLPVSTACTGLNTFVTTVRPALQLPQGVNRDDRVRHLVLQCAGLLEEYFLQWPDQYAGWDL